MTNPIPGGRVINLSGPRDALPEFDNMESEKQVAANKFIADTPANREMVAHQHGLLWCSIASDSRYSIVDAIRHQRPALKLVCAKAYLEALTEAKPQGSRKAQSFIEQFVFLMLFIDLQRYERRGAGVVKPGLNKKALVNLTNAFLQSQGSSTTAKEKKVSPANPLQNCESMSSLRPCSSVASQCHLLRDIVLDSMEMQLIRTPNSKQGHGGN